MLQYLKQTVDRFARTQEGFEKRLGRARKTMVYRAQVRNSQVPESRARQLLRQMTSRTELVGPDGVFPPTLEKTGSKAKLPASSVREKEDSRSGKGGASSQDQGVGGGGGGRGWQSMKKRNKKVSTDTLYAVIVFYEFLQELASISEEQSVVHSLLYVPKSNSLLTQ